MVGYTFGTHTCIMYTEDLKIIFVGLLFYLTLQITYWDFITQLLPDSRSCDTFARLLLESNGEICVLINHYSPTEDHYEKTGEGGRSMYRQIGCLNSQLVALS